MDARRRARKAGQEEALEPLGVSASPHRILTGMVRRAGEVGAILALPVDRSQRVNLQDPVTGRKKFIPGISDPGGDDEL